MAAVIAFDKRAVHRVVSDPTVLDIANDVDADAQEAHALLLNAGFLALGTGNEPLIRILQRVDSKVTHIRVLVHEGLDLYHASHRVDPTLAVIHGGAPDAA